MSGRICVLGTGKAGEALVAGQPFGSDSGRHAHADYRFGIAGGHFGVLHPTHPQTGGTAQRAAVLMLR